MAHPAFRIDLDHEPNGWVATVWKAESGIGAKHSIVQSTDIGEALRQASHYVLVASGEPVCGRKDLSHMLSDAP